MRFSLSRRTRCKAGRGVKRDPVLLDQRILRAFYSFRGEGTAKSINKRVHCVPPSWGVGEADE